MTKTVEMAHLQKTLIAVITDNPCPRTKPTRGRPPIHSKDKMDFACPYMMASNDTCRNAESDLRIRNTPWSDQPAPDHIWLCRHLRTIPEDWVPPAKTRDFPNHQNFSQKWLNICAFYGV